MRSLSQEHNFNSLRRLRSASDLPTQHALLFHRENRPLYV